MHWHLLSSREVDLILTDYNQFNMEESNLIRKKVPRIGRPRKFKTVEELEGLIQEYLDSCFEERWYDEPYRNEDTGELVLDQDGKPMTKPVKYLVQVVPPTICGLAVALGSDRSTLLDYQNEEKFKDFSHTIKNAKAFIEQNLEEGMVNGRVPAASGIFNLTNNFKWKNSQHTDVKSSGSISHEFQLKDKQRDSLKKALEINDNN